MTSGTVAVSKLLKKTFSEFFIYAVTFKLNKKSLTIVVLILAVVTSQKANSFFSKQNCAIVSRTIDIRVVYSNIYSRAMVNSRIKDVFSISMTVMLQYYTLAVRKGNSQRQAIQPLDLFKNLNALTSRLKSMIATSTGL